MTESPFRRRAVAWLAAIGLGSFALGLVFAVLGQEWAEVRSRRADSFSYSAIGHRALLDLLGRLDVPVLVSRHDTATRDGEGAALVLLEPPAETSDQRSALARLMREARDWPALVVLPKWTPAFHPERADWVGEAEPVPQGDLDALLEVGVGTDARVRRPGPVHVWSFAPALDGVGLPRLRAPQLLSPDAEDIEPLVWAASGTLLGVLRDASPPVFVLSDPDVLANHGLHAGDNAVLAVAALELVRGDRVLVFDETLHGHELEPSVWMALGRFPLVLVSAQALLVVAVLLWAATRRFGAPVPEPPDLGRGRRVLIENTAELLRFGGHSPHTLLRYWRATVRDLGRALHAPQGLDRPGELAWLERAARARKVSEDPVALDRAVIHAAAHASRHHAGEGVALARRIHALHQKLTES